MSMLGAFFRGAAGAGLVDYANRLDRGDAAAAEADRRKRERDEERDFRAEQAKLDRDARAEVAGIRGGKGKSSSGGGGGDGQGDDNYTVAAVMKKYGVSEAKARQMVEASRQDANPFQQTVNDESGGHAQPDMARWAELNRTLAEAMVAGPSMARSSYDALEKGRGQAQTNQVNQGMLDGKLSAPQTAEAIAAMSGKGAYGNAKGNEFTGMLTKLGQSEANENNAQAGSAGRANRGDLDGLKLPPAVKATFEGIRKQADEINKAIVKAKADGMWEPDTNKSQGDLVVRLRVLNDKAESLLKPYIPGVGKADGEEQAIRDRLAGKGDSEAEQAKPGQKPKPARENPAEDARLARQPKPPEPPGMLDRAAAWLRQQHDVPGAIRRRIQEAKAGGDPLTPGEIQLAQKHGIAV